MKLRSFGICILLIAILFCLALPMQAAFAESTPIILLSGKPEGNELVVTAFLRNNEGISAMQLALDYDKEKLTLVECKVEDALSELDPEPTLSGPALKENEFYTIIWDGDHNDTSNGKLLTLRFTIKENAEGQAFVGFARDQVFNCFEGGEVKTRNLMTDTLRIDLSSGEATAILSEKEDETKTVTDEEKETDTAEEEKKKVSSSDEGSATVDKVEEEKDGNTALIVGLAVGGTLGVLLVVGIPWFAVRKKKK